MHVFDENTDTVANLCHLQWIMPQGGQFHDALWERSHLSAIFSQEFWLKLVTQLFVICLTVFEILGCGRLSGL